MKKLLVLLTLTLLTSAWLFADWEQAYKALADDGTVWDYFGCSVSISGDYAVVGAKGDDDSSGSAYMFHRSGATWTQQVKLTADDGAPWDFFGNSVSVSGDYAIVGAFRDDDNGDNSGSAYIFYRNGTVWTQQAKLTADDGSAGDFFGCSVSISGDYAVVGAYQDDDNGDESGSAYIFYRSGTAWIQQAKLTADDGAAYDCFGYSVSICGDYAIVGAIWDGGGSGSAYMFHRNGTVWTQQDKLTADDGAAGDFFGCSVSISGDYAIVGAYGDDDNGDMSGSAYMFYRNETAWIQQAKLTADDGAYGDYFGDSVSISGNYAIVGASRDEDNGVASGSAYMFHRNGAVWAQQAKLTADDGALHAHFGTSVSINGDYAIVGAPYDDDNGDMSGSAYMFEYSEIAIDEDSEMPIATTLQAAYPNPFNPTTTIAFSLAEPAQITLCVYNLRGQLVRTLADGLFSAGGHSVVWDGLDTHGEAVSTGVYLFRLETGSEVHVSKALLLK
ncbi:MAG: T9SS type A sorting domain-containing protein [Candidatus Cloacimonetes bacterium]|nr:T9SS type A sorting domain-containing protein [Candidatus Cloacimonadota bacterium]